MRNLLTVEDEVRPSGRREWEDSTRPRLHSGAAAGPFCRAIPMVSSGRSRSPGTNSGHIFAGLEAWQHGRFQWCIDRPPLGHYWLTLPLARAPVQIGEESSSIAIP